MGKFFAALSLFTIIPVPQNAYSTEDFKDCQKCFVMVGAVIGGLCALCGWAFSHILPSLPLSVIGTGLLLFFSGGLHLDGLADSADGLLSCRPKERILEIMKDSRIGTFGAAAMILLLLLKTVCLASLGSEMWRGLLLAPICGRAVVLVQLRLLPTARPGGMGASICGTITFLQILLAVLLPVAVGGLLYGNRGLAGSVCALVISGLLFTRYVKGKIGGFTGDTLGASSEMAEGACLLGMCLNL